MKKWYIFKGGDILLERHASGTLCVPEGDVCPLSETRPATALRVHPINETAEVFAVRLPRDYAATAPYELHGLRATYGLLPRHEYLVAGKCEEILYWDSETQYCSRCGAPMKFHTDISKICESCGREVWPLLSTAIIVLVTRGDEALLVRAKNFRGSFHGLVAGFVETGETLEDCVRREVKEETGLEIDGIEYVASQPWPYPCGLMVGFKARYVGGEIRVQEEELTEAGWFRRDALPEIPGKVSMARKLIDEWRVKE